MTTRKKNSEFGKYTVIKRIGIGGCGIVYKVKDNSGEVFALKTTKVRYKDKKDKEECERYLKSEYKILEKLKKSSYAVDVFDCDFNSKKPYFVMELLEGPALYDVIEKNCRLTVRECVSILRDICDTLIDLDYLCVVHRDIKPENIILSSNGTKLIDFGMIYDRLSVAKESDLDILGTPYYICPEYISGKKEKLSIKSDVYSLAMTLYHALTGNPAFSGPTRKILLKQISKDMPNIKSVPSWLNKLLHSMADKNPLSRPSPKEIISQLKGR